MDCGTQTTSLNNESQEVPIEESFEMISIDSQSSPETPGPKDVITIESIQEHLALLVHSIKCQIKDEQMSHECSFPNCETVKDILNSTKDGWYIRSLVPSASNFKKMEPVIKRSDDEETPKETDWRDNFTDEIRKSLAYKILNAIFPIKDQADIMRDQRMLNIVAYAKKVEMDIFEKATSKSHYFTLLDDKIHSIEDQLAEERAARKQREEKQLEVRAILAEKQAARRQRQEKQLEVRAIDAAKTKDWHNSMTKNLRDHFVYTLVQAILPTRTPTSKPIPVDINRLKEFISYARTVECDIYTMAGSRSEYYRLVSDVMVKVQDDLETKVNTFK